MTYWNSQWLSFTHIHKFLLGGSPDELEKCWVSTIFLQREQVAKAICGLKSRVSEGVPVPLRQVCAALLMTDSGYTGTSVTCWRACYRKGYSVKSPWYRDVTPACFASLLAHPKVCLLLVMVRAVASGLESIFVSSLEYFCMFWSAEDGQTYLYLMNAINNRSGLFELNSFVVSWKKWVTAFMFFRSSCGVQGVPITFVL